MDPVSAVASVIAIATVASQVGSAFAELRRDCSELPARLHALSNEVADIEFVLHQVAAVLQERHCLSNSDKESIPVLLAQADTKLKDLRNILGRLKGNCTTKRVLLRASTWRKWQPKLQDLQTDIKGIKCSLNVLLGASNSRDLIRVRLDLENLSRTSSRESDEYVNLRNNISRDIAVYHDTLTRTVGQTVDKVDQRISNIERAWLAEATVIDESQYIDSPFRGQPPAATMRQQLRDLPAPPYADRSLLTSQAVGIRVKKNVGPICRPGCFCICHTERKSDTSGYFDRIIGRLFVGYAGLPLLSSPCDTAACERSQRPYIWAEYWFPMGFCWSQIICFQLGFQPNIGPQWELSTLRRVPDSAQCVRFALGGDIDGLKRLFLQGLASPKDVSSTRGYSLLRWALFGQQYETCRFLLAAGSDPDYKPVAVNDNCPSDKASDILLRGNLNINVVEILRCIARDSEFIEDQEFAPIHKIVLGLSLQDLETEILRDPSNVDVRDATGRTALEWAAARSDAQAVVTLLRFGADPNIMDNKLNTPLTLASNQGHTACVRLLCEAGALPDPVLAPGVRFGSPLYCAARNANDPALIKTLLDFDAYVEVSDVEGVTPLLHAARGKPVEFVTLLLDYGADINAMSKDGRTALSSAIIYNNHGVLQLLLDRWSEYWECPRLKGLHLLDLVIDYADIKTMSILTKASHFQSHGDNSYVLAKFGPQLRKRHDLTKELIAAFELLLDAIRERPKRSIKGKIVMYDRTFDLKKETESLGDESDSVDDFEDAHERVGLVSNDLSTLPRYRTKPTAIPGSLIND